MGDLYDPHSVEFWHREMRELADDMGSTTSDQVRARQATYLAGFVRTGAPVKGAAAANITIATARRWAGEDPVFHKARELATEAYSDLLVAEVTRRGVEGIEVIVRDRHGSVVGEERKYSDDLLKFALKGLDAGARWTQRAESGARESGSWRADLAKILADPEKRAALEALNELLGAS